MSTCRCVSPPHCHNGQKCLEEATDGGLCDCCALCETLNGACGLPDVPEVLSEPVELAKVWTGQPVTDAVERAAEDLGV